MDNNLKISTLAVFGLVAASMGSLGADCSRPMTAEMQPMYSMLDDAHKKMFDSMNCEGQDQAMQMMSQTCAGKNSCKGMNSCKSAKNSCAGQGSCAGTSMGPFKDKNKAVDLANKRMNMMNDNS